MTEAVPIKAAVLPFPAKKKQASGKRKSGLNKNREGSVRNVNGKIYVDFTYLGERIREPSNLDWNESNAKAVRQQLDRIIVRVRDGSFKFSDVFPHSKKKGIFDRKEKEAFGSVRTPDDVRCGDYMPGWYDLLKDSGRVTGRTLLGYKGYMDRYLTPFFGPLAFAELNAATFEKFVSWARKRRYRGKEIQNRTLNKVFTVLKMVCKSAAIEHGWGRAYDPFFGFKKLPENDAYESILPFSTDEQKRLLEALPAHWRLYFRFAFAAGLRPGEQIGLKPEDIDWEKKVIHVRRAVTRDVDGKRAMGNTKNRYSRRQLKMTPVMLDILQDQQRVQDRLGSEFFFCTVTGKAIDLDHLRQRIWAPAMRRASLPFREMKQTRHTFATLALSLGESPLWIARFMGHRNTEMIIRVYGKYIESAKGEEDGAALSAALQGIIGNGE